MKPAQSLALALLLAACRAVAPSHRIVDTRSGADIGLWDMADAVANADVVFLGEVHDNDAGHELQLELTRALLQRNGEVAVSLEMFERDVQPQLDMYLAGTIGEARFLGNARPWSNYAEHYRPLVELAKRHRLDVIAANCPRPLAARTSREGLAAVAGDPFAALHVDTTADRYWELFRGALGDHAGAPETGMERVFAAQCLKDDTMAESIVRYLERRGDAAPQVVHLCGRFHSDYGLGTVSRLLRRRPELEVAVVSTVPTERVGRRIEREELELADYLWLVAPSGGR